MITALHGFLGLPADWDFFPVNAVPLGKAKPFWKWAEQFNKTNKDKPRILMGYSLGGRLALHALVASPQQWDAAIIISAHPGLDSQQDKTRRLEKSLAWAARFETDPWDDLMRDWEAQDVFVGNTFRFNRKESDYDRHQLADMLRVWSLGRQENLVSQVQKLPCPILWIAGQNDPTYAGIVSTLSLVDPKSKVWIVPSAGHRVPWEQPDAFKNEVNLFLSRLHQ